MRHVRQFHRVNVIFCQIMRFAFVITPNTTSNIIASAITRAEQLQQHTLGFLCPRNAFSCILRTFNRILRNREELAIP